MEFHINIQCDNEVFGFVAFDAKPEIARILRKYADRLDADGEIDCRLTDINGNVVGEAAMKFTDEEEQQ